MTRTRVGVVPAAGFDSSILSEAQALPKVLLPVGGRLAIDWILEEAALAGLERIFIVSSDRKPAMDRLLEWAELADHFGIGVKWRTTFGTLPMRDIEIVLIHQPEPQGIGSAILGARSSFGNESVAVLVPNELLLGAPVLLASMLEHHERGGHSVVSLMKSPLRDLAEYDCADVVGAGPHGTCLIRGCAENSDPTLATSNYSLCGRYVLGADVLDELARAIPDHQGEVRLTSALNVAAIRGDLVGVKVVSEDGWVNIGTRAGWLSANCRHFESAKVTRAPARRSERQLSTPLVSVQAD